MNDSTKKPAVAVTFRNANNDDCGIDEQPAYMVLRWGDLETTIVDRVQLQACLDTFMWHGAKQKFIDGAAIARNPDTGRSATIADKREAVLAIIARAEQGEWFARRGEGGGATTLLLAALVRVYPTKTPEALRAYIAGLDADGKRALERNPRVAPVIEAIRTERRLAQGSSVDSDAMLDDIENL